MHDPKNGKELSISVRPLSICLNCGRSMNLAFAVPARHDLELRIFQCEHCNFEDMILRHHVSLLAPKQLTHYAALADDSSLGSS
jgi:hypothetical protein